MSNVLKTIEVFKNDLIEHIATMECPEDLTEAVMYAVDDVVNLWLFHSGYSYKDVSA